MGRIGSECMYKEGGSPVTNADELPSVANDEQNERSEMKEDNILGGSTDLKSDKAGCMMNMIVENEVMRSR